LSKVKKKRVAWNKGLTADTDARVKANTDACHETTKQKYASGELIHHAKGKTKNEYEPLANMSKTKKSKFKSGELVMWCKGETKESNDSVAKRTETQLEQYASGEREGYWKDKKLSATHSEKISISVQKAYDEGKDIGAKGHTAWNKGLTKETDERVADFSKIIKTGYNTGRIGARKGKTKETDASSKRQSDTMKQKILSGEFTPNTQNWKYKNEFVPELGHYVRSKWELNICKLLKSIGCIYEYETKRFELKLIDGETTIYIPDLYIPEENLIIEIKGYHGKDKENLKKFDVFRKQCWSYNTLLIDNKPYQKLIKSKVKTFDEFLDLCKEQ